ncbi:MAG: (d)CMP kinase [Bacteroidota bacterium]
MKKIIIAIDGFSSCGKSTLARQLAAKLDYVFIDSGAMYRAVTLYLIQRGIDHRDAAAVEAVLPQIYIHFERQASGNLTFLNGEAVEQQIRQTQVSDLVSPVATLSAVRRMLVQQQQKLGESKGIIMDGRDIGTVVFPRAELKIFLTATTTTRAERRYLELQQKGTPADIDWVRHNLEERDRIDSTRADSPLRQASDAVVIDNTNLKPEEQLAMVMALARMRIGS